MASDLWRVTDEQDGDWTVWAKMPSGQWQLITFADSESVATNIMETLSGSARLATLEAERDEVGVLVREATQKLRSPDTLFWQRWTTRARRWLAATQERTEPDAP